MLTFSMPAVTPNIRIRQTARTTTVCHKGFPNSTAAAWKNSAGSAVIRVPVRDPTRLFSTQPRMTA